MSASFRAVMLKLPLLIIAAAPWAAVAQAEIGNLGSASAEDRITSLERISTSQAQLLQQLQQQVNDLQSEIASLRGQVQQDSYQLNQATERQKQLWQQLDNLNGNSVPPAAGDKATPEVKEKNSADAEPVPVATQSSDANSDYNNAVALVLEKKQYDRAIDAFQAFVKKYPDSTYQPNANYWLGQLNYNKGKKDDAAYYFATVVKKYPKSPKSPDALYKVGVIMQEKGDGVKAKVVWQQVIKQYPGTDAASQAQKRVAGQ